LALFVKIFGSAPSAARYAAETASFDISVAGTKSLKTEIFTPMQSKNNLSPLGAISVLQDVTAPMKYNLRRSKERLEEALAKLDELKVRIPTLQAKDLHYLSKCHGVRSMALCAELTFRAALMRTESRGFHFREDFPERDDKNWLKWIILKQNEDKMELSTRPVPIGKYKIKPIN